MDFIQYTGNNLLLGVYLMKDIRLRRMLETALCTALLCIAAPLIIPLTFSAVPLSLATWVVYIISAILGLKRGVICVLLYLLIGVVGVPVFSGWEAGFQKFIGPTGGYLAGYIFIAGFTGFSSDKFGFNTLMCSAFMILGTLFCYALGTMWLAYAMKLSIGQALLAGVVPYIPLDIVKIATAAPIAIKIKRRLTKIHSM